MKEKRRARKGEREREMKMSCGTDPSATDQENEHKAQDEKSK